MESCPFCAIVQKRLSAEIVYEDENALAFRDIRPQAPVHVLIVPKEHVDSVDEVQDPADAGRQGDGGEARRVRRIPARRQLRRICWSDSPPPSYPFTSGARAPMAPGLKV